MKNFGLNGKTYLEEEKKSNKIWLVTNAVKLIFMFKFELIHTTYMIFFF